ncbi:biotin--[acetyl-CoA-carboxylase] ligase [Candidatus Jidaibacter acanthamoebae]|nr:biotin--[acetyl-CoA-carboxylase] ligase [Candidatus Jidaibacter acanthamoeba]
MSKLENWLIKKYQVLDSTQEEAKRLIDSGEARQGYVLLAEEQTKAHGKLDKLWEGSKSDIALTMILKPEIEADRLGQICYIAALAVAKSIKSLSPSLNVEFKWVNDVLINGQKVCGILLEKVKHDFVLVGIGVNLKYSAHLAKYNATSLEAYKVAYDYDALVEDILKNFIDIYNMWLDAGFSPVKNKWLSQAKGINSTLNVNLADKSIEGIFIGIEDEGNLLLVTGGGIKSIPAGDVFFKI